MSQRCDVSHVDSGIRQTNESLRQDVPNRGPLQRRSSRLKSEPDPAGLCWLLALSHKYRCDQIEQACEIAWRHGDFHLRTIRRLIDRSGPVQELMPFLEDHELIRPLADYDAFVHEYVQGRLTS